MMYTKGCCLFFGLSAMSSLHSNLRASRKLRLICSSLYPLAFNLNLSGYLGPILCRFLRYTDPFMNPWNTELGWQDVLSRYWYVSVGLVHILG